MSAPGRRWTEEEDAILRARWGSAPRKVIGAELDRSPLAVTHRGALLGLTLDAYADRRRAKQREVVAEFWGEWPAHLIAARAGTSAAVVRQIAADLGLRARAERARSTYVPKTGSNTTGEVITKPKVVYFSPETAEWARSSSCSEARLIVTMLRLQHAKVRAERIAA